MGNTSGVRVSKLPEDHKMIMDEIVWNEMFGVTSDERFRGFGVELRWSTITEGNNTNKDHGNKKDMSRKTWNKEVSNLFDK